MAYASYSVPFPNSQPVRRSCAPTIERVPVTLSPQSSRVEQSTLEQSPRSSTTPIVVAIGPYYHGLPQLQKMEEVKHHAMEYFCRGTGQSRELLRTSMLTLAGPARRCYAEDPRLEGMDEDSFTNMMLLDGCFLLQFMISMCPDEHDAPPEPDPLMSLGEVHTRIDAIVRDILLLDNQIPWIVLEELMTFRVSDPVPVERFVLVLAAAFDVAALPGPGGEPDHEPPHLLGLFHHRQVGGARTESFRIPSLSSLSSTAIELAEMGVKLTASKTKKFWDMSVRKRRRLHLGGELSLAPLVLNDLTACWLHNMAAYEACLGASRADNFAVSSYMSVLSLLMNREEDVRELRAKGMVISEFSDSGTLSFFKALAPHLRVGHRYYEIFERLHEYKQERWIWIPVHKFFYKNIKTILAVLSIIGVLAGLFKTLLSLNLPKQ